MKTSTLLLSLGACLALDCLSLDCQAQSFGDIFRSAANSAASSAATSAADQAARSLVSGLVDRVKGGDGGAKPAPAPADAPAQDAAAAPQSGGLLAMAGLASKPALPAGCKHVRGADLLIGPRPADFEPAGLWPENADCPVGSFSGLSFEKAKEARNAFADASKVPCNDCEGGYAIEAWGRGKLVKGGDTEKEIIKLLLALEQGKSLGWSGTRHKFTVTATGAHPIGDTPCRQYRYEMKDGATTVAAYDSLLCEYKRPYAGHASWNEVI